MGPQRADYLLFERALIARPVQSKIEGRVEHGRGIDAKRHTRDDIKSIRTRAVAVNIVAAHTRQSADVEESRIVEQGFAQRQFPQVTIRSAWNRGDRFPDRIGCSDRNRSGHRRHPSHASKEPNPGDAC